jgi:hypothetical protein
MFAFSEIFAYERSTGLRVSSAGVLFDSAEVWNSKLVVISPSVLLRDIGMPSPGIV